MDHSLKILEREGLDAYATVIGQTPDQARRTAIRELTGVPHMTQFRDDLIDDQVELERALELANQGRVKQMVQFGLVILALLGAVSVVGYVLKTTSTFVERDLPRIVR